MDFIKNILGISGEGQDGQNPQDEKKAGEGAGQEADQEEIRKEIREKRQETLSKILASSPSSSALSSSSSSSSSSAAPRSTPMKLTPTPRESLLMAEVQPIHEASSPLLSSSSSSSSSPLAISSSSSSSSPLSSSLYLSSSSPLSMSASHGTPGEEGMASSPSNSQKPKFNPDHWIARDVASALQLKSNPHLTGLHFDDSELTEANLDFLFISMIDQIPGKSQVSYLMACLTHYLRLHDSIHFKKLKTFPVIDSYLTKAQKIVINLLGSSIDDDLFSVGELDELFLNYGKHFRLIMNHFTKEFPHSSELFKKLIDAIFIILPRQKLIDNETITVLQCLEVIVGSSPDIGKLLFTHPRWTSRDFPNPHDYIKGTYFGLLLQFSIDPQSAETLFVKSGWTRNDSAVAQSELHARRKLVNDIVFNLMVQTKEREPILHAVSDVLELFSRRGQMYFQNYFVSTCFMTNLFSLLFKFFEPIINKKNIIDASYLPSNFRLDHGRESKLASSDEELSKWIDKRNQSRIDEWNQQRKNLGIVDIADPKQVVKKDSYGFTTEVFFLLVRCLNLGLVADFQKFASYMNSHFFPEYDRVKATGSPTMEFDDMDRFRSIQHTILFDTEIVIKVSRVFQYLADWLVDQLKPLKTTPIQLGPPSSELSLQPEYLISDMVHFVINALGYHLNVHGLDLELTLPKIMDCLTMFLSSPNHLHNPHLRTDIVHCLSTIANHGKVNGALVFRTPVLTHSLIPIILRFYYEIEITGSHTQFFTKFTARSYAQRLLTKLISYPDYFKSLRDSFNDRVLFVKFVDKILNDQTLLLDDALLALNEIVDAEELMNGPDWEALSQEEKDATTSKLDQQRKIAKGSFQIANSTLEFLLFVVRTIKEAFLSPDIAPRLCNMLTYFLKSVIKKNLVNFRVENPQQYHFFPQKLVADLISIFIQMNVDSFVQLTVLDDHFSIDLFKSSFDIIQREALSVDLYATQQLINNLEKFVNLKKDLEPNYDDAPDEFFDALTSNVMTDPVELPSGNIVDRSTILRVLMSNPTDPFTKQPLSEQDLIPLPDLKKRIDAYVASKK